MSDKKKRRGHPYAQKQKGILSEGWQDRLKQTNAYGILSDAYSAYTAPYRAYKGLLDPMSDEAIADMSNLAGMVTLGAGAIPAEANSLRMGIKAYHGSPHDFDKFRMDKIGTGEGAQAYGHGLYFAENEGIAKSYRDSLTASRMLVDGKPFTPGNYAITQMIADSADRPDFQDILRRYIQNEKDNPYSDVGDVQKVLDSVERGTFEIPNTGRLYEVNINANPDDFLDWDKPLSEQPGVAQKLGLRIKSEKELTDEAYSIFDEYGTFDNMPPEARRRVEEINDEINRPGTNQTGREIYEFGVGRQENVHDFLSGPSPYRSEELRASGIPGIKYLDAGSRGSGEGSRNYVVFDENLINIVRKYGIVGALSSGLITAQQAQQIMQQEKGRQEFEKAYQRGSAT